MVTQLVMPYATMQATAEAPIPLEALRPLQQRSDARGLLRFAGHLLAIVASGLLYGFLLQRGTHPLLVLPALVAYGFTFVTMFAAMHEAMHRTAFKTVWLNNTVGWLAGLLSFYNSDFFRYYHTWHHRFANLPGKDPELDDPQPTSVGSYVLAMSGLHWWAGKLQTHALVALGKVEGYPFLNDKTRRSVVRSVRLQLLVYGVAVALSLALGQPYFLLYWLLPVAAAQPLLRIILLAEHTGCSEDDNALSNTRTTLTSWPVRFLMWEMPYHAEHHRYPQLPFFALASAHRSMQPHLVHVARRGYLGVHHELLRKLSQKSAPRLSA
ncbi:MAG: fatty acid desaturase [Myxococcaceae bacterium]|nr:fatty acid desaturase [Myxococcaceae bacterium]